MKSNSIARLRLEHQHLVAPALGDPAAVVRALGAVQSQDYTGAKWAIAQRITRPSDAAIERAFADGAILRTHVLRPTWHFVLPEDARWMLELTAPRVLRAMASSHRRHELDAQLFRRSHAVLERALRDGQQRTRAELSAALRRVGLDVTKERMGHLLMRAELDRVVISGARRGKQFTYALFDERVPAAPARDRDAALEDLTRRYFATRGPATVQDFAWWSGLTVADAKRGVEIAAAFLAPETHDDRTYWQSRSQHSHSRRATPLAHLLPNYDELMIGFKDRAAFAERLRRVSPRRRIDGLFGHVVCIDGQIVGGWQRTVGKTVEVVLNLLVTLTARERDLARRAAERFGQFLGAPVRVRSRRAGR